MGVLLGMFREFARLGMSRAAAFFYAVAVGVVANVVIAHFSPHPGDPQSTAEAPAAFAAVTAPVVTAPAATAVIAPKPAASVQPVEVSAPVGSAATYPLPPIAVPAINAAALLTRTNPPVGTTALPNTATMTPPPLQPTALPSAPAAAALAAPQGGATLDKPASNVEASATSTAAAPISLLPSDPQAAPDQLPPKPAKPGPGSGGLY